MKHPTNSVIHPPIYLASDYDGTFKQGAIRQEDKDAIERFRSRGCRFGLVTGRSYSMLEQEFDRYGLTMDFMIANTGGAIFDRAQNVLFKKPIETQLVQELLADLEKRRAAMYGVASLHKHSRLYLDPALARSQAHNGSGLPQYSREAVEQDGDIISLFIRGRSQEDSYRLYQELVSAYSGRLAFHYNGGAIDVTADGASKTEGVRALQSLVPQARVCVIGDEMNDIDMIRAFGGFSVTSGNEAVRQAASRVFDHISDCIDFLLED